MLLGPMRVGWLWVKAVVEEKVTVRGAGRVAGALRAKRLSGLRSVEPAARLSAVPVKTGVPVGTVPNCVKEKGVVAQRVFTVAVAVLIAPADGVTRGAPGSPGMTMGVFVGCRVAVPVGVKEMPFGVDVLVGEEAFDVNVLVTVGSGVERGTVFTVGSGVTVGTGNGVVSIVGMGNMLVAVGVPVLVGVLIGVMVLVGGTVTVKRVEALVPTMSIALRVTTPAAVIGIVKL